MRPLFRRRAKPPETIPPLNLGKTRSRLGLALARLTGSGRALDEALIDEIEAALLAADIGVKTSDEITAALRAGRWQSGGDPLLAIRGALLARLEPLAQPLLPDPTIKPFVILVVGVNGAGKTTTIAKLAERYRAEGRSVIAAAADTFRAAAIEQLQEWGRKTGTAVIAGKHGADPAAVAHDALQAAVARQTDVLLIDTAGRLHTQAPLMAELQKIRRVVQRDDPTRPHETLLVLDAGAGQNAVLQARAFHQALNVTGLVLTKLDGTARGGVLAAIGAELALPVRFIGTGESAADLRPFDPAAFVAAILPASGEHG